MSYCRWSSDNWRCDLYCFGDGNGFTTHVAANRVVGEIPPEPEWPNATDLPPEYWSQFAERHNAVMEFLSTAVRRPIGLPHDGETFHDGDLASFLDRLESLRAAGYHFPDYVLDEVRAELSVPRGDTTRGDG